MVRNKITLQIQRTNNQSVRLLFPSSWYTEKRLICFIKKYFGSNYVFKKSPGGSNYCIILRTNGHVSVDIPILRMFSSMNGLPVFEEFNPAKFKNPRLPILSCIILVNHNKEFVRKFLIPSIIQNTSKQVPYEISIINIGKSITKNLFGELPVLPSDVNWISKGYNLGARQARGKYLAFFHDDCIIDDPHWVDKSLSVLSDHVYAVTPEIQMHGQFVKLKAVPLIISRETFFGLGGFDERYVHCNEDIDLTYKILKMSTSRIECLR